MKHRQYCNWKMVMENNVDGYHALFTHQSVYDAVRPAKVSHVPDLVEVYERLANERAAALAAILPPTVIATIPDDGAGNVPVASKVMATFSRGRYNLMSLSSSSSAANSLGV